MSARPIGAKETVVNGSLARQIGPLQRSTMTVPVTKLDAVERLPTRPAIRIRELRKQFGALVAIDDVSVDIGHGEFFMIVGPSGCGKTTLLRILAGLDSVTSGTIEIETPNSQRPVNSMIFQGDSIFPWMTVWDNAAYGLKMRRVPSATIKEVVGHYLARTDKNTPAPASQVAYIDCTMGPHIAPAGWLIDGYTRPVADADVPDGGRIWTLTGLRFAEYHSVDPSGAPIDVSQRIPESTQLSDAEAAQLRDVTYVFGGWDPKAGAPDAGVD